MGTPASAGDVDKAIALLHEVVQLFRATLAGKSDALNLPVGQLRALSHVYHHEPCTVGDVAAGIGVSLATASELLERLADADWVARSVDPADRRRAVMTLTPRARELGSRVHEMRRRQISAAFAGLGKEEQRGFIVGLQAVIGTLNEALNPESSCGKTDRTSFTTS